MSRITTGKDKIPKNSILATIFALRQGFKDTSCPGQEIRGKRSRYHSWKAQMELPAWQQSKIKRGTFQLNLVSGS